MSNLGEDCKCCRFTTEEKDLWEDATTENMQNLENQANDFMQVRKILRALEEGKVEFSQQDITDWADEDDNQ